jgi:sRNA-binding protein
MKRVAAVVSMMIVLMFGLVVTLPAQGKAPGVVILKGNPMGDVKYDHAAHAKLVADKCETCHHDSRAEKPAKAKQEKCQDCHTRTATPPMKTGTKLAFHNATAKLGICVDCHLKEAAAGKKVPVKCTECHKKENV